MRGSGGRMEVFTILASAQPVFGLHISPFPMSPRARWARGARSPEAPTVPFSGTQERQLAEEGEKEQSIQKCV